MSPEIMALPTNDGEYILDTDASLDAIGATLSQVQNGRERVIAYGGRTLSKTERNYCVTDRELLAVRYFIEYYRQYLLGRKFLVRTDHQALRWLFSLRDPKDKIARWLETLSAFCFSIEYRPGHKHANADAMSRRCPRPHECRCPLLEDEEILKCGPCNKCKRRATLMDSDLMTAEGALNPEYELKLDEKYDIAEDENTIRAVRICEFGEPSVKVARAVRANERKNRRGSPPKKRRKLGRAGRIRCRKAEIAKHGYNLRNRGDGTDNSRGSDATLPATTSPVTQHKFWALPKLSELREKQLADPDIAPIIKWKEEGRRPSGKEISIQSPATRQYWLYWEALFLTEGVLFRRFAKRDGVGHYVQFIVPRTMTDAIMYQAHNALSAGHLGRKKTSERLLRRFFWYQMREDCDIWIERCDTCASVKKPPKKARAPLGEMLVGAPLDRVAMDTLGMLPETPRMNRCIMVMSDNFTKWAELLALINQQAKTCSDALTFNVFCRYGYPQELHSDQGRNFESQIFKELCTLFEIRKTRTSPGNPRCNGQVEQFNATLVKMIKSYLKGEQTDWDLALGALAGAYRASIHSSTGFTPNMMMLHREIEPPIAVMFGTHHHESYPSYGEYVADMKSKMQKAHDVARAYLGKAARRYKEMYDTKVNQNEYSIGDLVWLETDISQLDITPKLRVPYEGPYMIWRKVGPLDYELYMSRDKKKIVHHNKLKRYHGLKRPPGFYKVLKEAKDREESSSDVQIATGTSQSSVRRVRRVSRRQQGFYKVPKAVRDRKENSTD